MRGKFNTMLVASMILGLTMMCLQVNADDVPGSNLSSTPATSATTPSMSAIVINKNQAAPVKANKELELNWNAAIGLATYDENSEEHSLSPIGMMLEINPGYTIPVAPGLDIGLVVGFLYITAEESFESTYTGPPSYTLNWDIFASSVGSYLLAKYSYDIDLGGLAIGLENGIGLGYFMNSVAGDWTNPSTGAQGDNSADENGWAPVVKAGLKLAFPVTKVSRLGLNAGMNLIPLTAGDYTNIFSFNAGLNYQVHY